MEKFIHTQFERQLKGTCWKWERFLELYDEKGTPAKAINQIGKLTIEQRVELAMDGYAKFWKEAKSILYPAIEINGHKVEYDTEFPTNRVQAIFNCKPELVEPLLEKYQPSELVGESCALVFNSFEEMQEVLSDLFSRK